MDPSTLRDRLRGILRAPAGNPTAGPFVSPAHTERMQAPAGAAVPIEDILSGQWRDHAYGRSFVVTRRVDPHQSCGRRQVLDLAACVRRAAGLAPLAAGGAPARPPLLFFDLETTGLGGGAGTHAFLVGCGRFDDQGAFVIEQHVLVDYLAEPSLLQSVGAIFAEAGALVSFNGKAFDIPVLETRCALHRLDSSWSLCPHIDILYPARRFWSGAGGPGVGRGQGCSLSALEIRVLDVERPGDIVGSEIPARYFRFLRTGDARPLAQVLEHNRLDLLSLAGLTSRLLHLLAEGPAAAIDAREALALGCLYQRTGQDDRAEGAFERSVELATCGSGRSRVGLHAEEASQAAVLMSIRADALRRLARAAHRARRFEAAATRWHEALGAPGCPPQIAREASEALAIHHEHRVRDLRAAKVFALKTLEYDRAEDGSELVRRRLARIDRKLINDRRRQVPSLPLPPVSGSATSARQISS